MQDGNKNGSEMEVKGNGKKWPEKATIIGSMAAAVATITSLYWGPYIMLIILTVIIG